MTPAPDDLDARIDPALRHLLAARTDLSADLLATVRTGLNQRRREAARTLDSSGVEITQCAVGDIRVRVYRGAGGRPPGVLYCHSGAFVLGNLDTDHRQCIEFARRARCVVCSVEYRLSPEHRYPAALDDAIAVLAWMVTEADALGIDAARIAVAGSSAGGALAATLARLAARAVLPEVVFQLLHQPVLDDRPTPSKQEFSTTPGFDGPACAQMWRYYAGVQDLWHAAPARNEELAGLAPALITCSELDPLRDEAIDYALRLLWAGVSTELYVYPGTIHGFDSLLPEWEVSRQLFAQQGAALERALHPG
ncbi:alpha/beta hydrolase [Mycolicibacterium mengxianglii]|uniref:alpha/beta hydrolase n=1 Tax=Mycolicibacterium mengxianglii TaxID=2736649 RepID=UPI001E29FDBD|nr:alpha/beta hydrolase [Mycolicibacterium mengxianglii]